MDTSKSLRSTPKHRPLKVLSAVRNGARSAPYAYNGRYERHVAGDMATTSAVRRNIYQQDPMPFTLIERVHSRKVKYRIPNKDEIALLHTTFPTAVTFRFEFPLIIVHCSRAPEQIPLTIGKVAAIFLAETDVYHPIPGKLGNPRNQDWLVDHPYDAEVECEAEFCARVLAAFKDHGLSPISVSLYLGSLIIELKEQIASYTLPGKLGGIVPHYCNGFPAWSRNVPLSRLITPEADTEDNSDYSSSGLGPAIRVCGQQCAGTSGLVVRNNASGERRLIVANHVFKDTNEVYYPTMKTENYIGSITHRYPSLDVALVALKNDVPYSNASYFDAPVPKRLVTSKYGGIPGVEWFLLDSPYTGLVPFLWTGVRLGIPEDLPETYHALQYDMQYTFLSMQVNIGRLPNGVCGSPSVHDETEDPGSDGAALGLFSWSDQNIVENLFVSVLDELMNDGWILESVDGVEETGTGMREVEE